MSNNFSRMIMLNAPSAMILTTLVEEPIQTVEVAPIPQVRAMADQPVRSADDSARFPTQKHHWGIRFRFGT